MARWQTSAPRQRPHSRSASRNQGLQRGSCDADARLSVLGPWLRRCGRSTHGGRLPLHRSAPARHMVPGPRAAPSDRCGPGSKFMALGNDLLDYWTRPRSLGRSCAATIKVPEPRASLPRSGRSGARAWSPAPATTRDIAASVIPCVLLSSTRILVPQYYFDTERGRAGLTATIGEPSHGMLWRLWSPPWQFDDRTRFDASPSGASTNRSVDVVIHSIATGSATQRAIRRSSHSSEGPRAAAADHGADDQSRWR